MFFEKKQGLGTANDLEGTHGKVQECCLASWVRIFSPSCQPVLSQKSVAWQGHCLKRSKVPYRLNIFKVCKWDPPSEGVVGHAKERKPISSEYVKYAAILWETKSEIGLGKQLHENPARDGASVVGDDVEIMKHHGPSGHQRMENRHLCKSGVSMCLSYGRWAVVVVKVKPAEPLTSPRLLGVDPYFHVCPHSIGETHFYWWKISFGKVGVATYFILF